MSVVAGTTTRVGATYPAYGAGFGGIAQPLGGFGGFAQPLGGFGLGGFGGLSLGGFSDPLLGSRGTLGSGGLSAPVTTAAYGAPVSYAQPTYTTAAAPVVSGGSVSIAAPATTSYAAPISAPISAPVTYAQPMAGSYLPSVGGFGYGGFGTTVGGFG